MLDLLDHYNFKMFALAYTCSQNYGRERGNG